MAWIRLGATLLLAVAACGDDDDDDAAQIADAGVDGGEGPTDAGLDARVDSGPEGCRAAPPLVGGTVETDALAESPARCGMAAYTWLATADLGDVLSREGHEDHTAAELDALLQVAGVVAPAPLEHDVAVETLVYRTQDRGARVESSALLAYPTDLEAGTEVEVMLVLHGTSGFTRDCGSTGTPFMRAMTAVFASLGWVAVAPDYLGLEGAGADYPDPHPYVIGEPTAIASLDAVRAAAKALAVDDGVCAATRVAVAGPSQGGHAALWVDRLAPYYARELTLIGTVAWVPASDLVAHADRSLRAVTPATDLMAAMLALHAAWYGFEDRLDEILLPPWDTDLPALLEESCLPEVSVGELDRVFSAELLTTVASESITAFEPSGCPLGESSLLDTSIARIGPDDPSYGILFVMGESDALVVPELERPAYDRLCSDGVPLQAIECAGAGHADAVLWSMPEAVQFLEDRRAGVPFAPECERPAAVRCLGTP